MVKPLRVNTIVMKSFYNVLFGVDVKNCISRHSLIKLTHTIWVSSMNGHNGLRVLWVKGVKLFNESPPFIN